MAQHRLHLDGLRDEDGLGDHIVRPGCPDHIIIKRTEGNRTCPGQDIDGKQGLLALPFSGNKDQ